MSTICTFPSPKTVAEVIVNKNKTVIALILKFFIMGTFITMQEDISRFFAILNAKMKTAVALSGRV
jgi:hypothetical protein